MKSKMTGPAMKVRLFAVVLLAAFAFAAAAKASTVAIKFNLPFEVHWGKKILPPGEYSVTMDSNANVALVQAVHGQTAFYTPIPIKTYNRTGNAGLYIMVRGDQRFVRSLNLPERGISFVYRPVTEAEREILAKADQLQTVPVTTAGK